MGKSLNLVPLEKWEDADLNSLIKLILRKIKENDVYNNKFRHFYHGINYLKKDILLRCKDKTLDNYTISIFWDTFYHVYQNEALCSILTIDIVNDQNFFVFFPTQREALVWVENFTKKEVEYALGSSVNNFEHLNLKCGLILKRYVDKYDDIMHYYNKASLLNIPGFAEKIKKI